MRLAIEFDYSASGARGGTHILNHLVAQMSRLAPENEYLAFGFFYKDYEARLNQFKLPGTPNVRLAIQRWPQSWVSRAEWGLKIPLIELHLALQGVDLYHCWRPPAWGSRFVVTVYDITPVIRPEWHNPVSQGLWKGVILPGMRRARRIITYCEHSKRDMVRELGLPEERIAVTPLGVDPSLFKPAENKNALEEARRRFKLPQRFFLMVGPLDEVCHFKAVLEALRLWRDSGSEPPLLVAVGPVNDYVRGLQNLAQEAGFAGNFVWTGYVFHQDLALIYHSAEALVHPSLLPGAELPPFEAMACGTPVITSLEENIADAGLLVDAKSPQALYSAMRRLWESPSLRAELREKSLKRAALFPWEKTAAETLQVYRQAA